MAIAVFATDDQWTEFSRNELVPLTRVRNVGEMHSDAQAIIILQEDEQLDVSGFTTPIFINAVSTTLKEMGTPANVIRFNGWPGFIDKKTWEVCGSMSEEAENVLGALEKNYKLVSDEEGFVAARIISMIINEAFFAIEDDISTREEIDTAMKLGTNYPLGPFEWCAKIGAPNIYNLLKKLSTRDMRYVPSRLLEKEAVL